MAVEELCDLVATGSVEAVYVDAQDRLSRGEDDEWVAFRALCDANDTWIVVDGQRITRDLGGKAMSYLRALLARQESDEKSHRTRSGLREAAKQGRYPVGAPPFGYRSVGEKRERRFLVEPAEAAIVQRIFSEYVGGIGVNRIAARLNAEGIRTRLGSPFTARSILAVLPNRTYLGEVTLKGEVLATAAHDPIIDPETFAQVERLRAAKRSRPNGGRGRPAKRHLLDGLLVCEHGHRMLARRRGQNEFYICSRRHTYGDCDAPYANRRRVDETFLNHWLTRHFDEGEMRERLDAASSAKIEEAQALAAQADREEQESAAALTRIRRDYMAGKISADDWNGFQAELLEEQSAAREQATQLRARAAEIEGEAAQVDVESQLVARLAALMQTVAGDTESPEAIAELRAALTATFERVVYQPRWSEAPEGAPIVLGEAELAPVLRSDLLAPSQNQSAAHGASPPGTPGRRDPRSQSRALRAGGEPPPRRGAARGRRGRG